MIPHKRIFDCNPRIESSGEPDPGGWRGLIELVLDVSARSEFYVILSRDLYPFACGRIATLPGLAPGDGEIT